MGLEIKMRFYSENGRDNQNPKQTWSPAMLAQYAFQRRLQPTGIGGHGGEAEVLAGGGHGGLGVGSPPETLLNFWHVYEVFVLGTC